MGILSEMDMMNRDAEDDAFEVSSDSETVDSFSEEFEPVEPPKPDPQAEDAEEARKKAEFDAAEAKRKAEWEAKQAQKKLREQQELDRLAAMSDDDVMQGIHEPRFAGYRAPDPPQHEAMRHGGRADRVSG